MADLRDEAYWDGVDDEIRSTADRVLTDSGPLSLDELVRRLESEGVLAPLIEDGYDGAALPDLVDDILAQTDDFLHGDDLVGSAEALVEGLTLTHVLTQDELDHDRLDLLDLGLLEWNREDGVGLAGGGFAHAAFAGRDAELDGAIGPHGSLMGPPAWLAAFAAGDPIVLRRREGLLDIAPWADVDDGSAEAERATAALAAAFDRQTGGDDTIGAEPAWLLQEAVLRDPTLFRSPVPPLSDLVERIGLERVGAWVGRAGADWAAPGVRRREEDESALFDRYDFDTCCIAAFRRVREGWTAFVLSEPDADIDARALARSLAHGVVSAAFVEDVLDRFPDGADRLERFSAALIDGAVGSDKGAAHYLNAMNAEAQGRVIDAEVHLEVAVREDPELSVAQISLAGYASDRGDAPRALRLLADAGLPADDDEVAFLRSLRPDPAKVGRNDPCPCGSGKKFKQCHLLDTSLPIERRSVWLLHKVSNFLNSRSFEEGLIDVAAAAMQAFQTVNAEMLDAEDFLDAFRAFADDPFLWSVAMVEGGGLVAFLERRGELLPDDEMAMATTWCDERRRLWEVVDVERNATLTLRDAAGGEQVVIAERLGSQNASIGQHFLAVVGVVGSERQSLGSLVDIPPPLRESTSAVLAGEPTAEDVASWYGGAFRLPG